MANILVVDDSEVIRTFLSEYLRDMGHEVDVASHGQEGIKKALDGDYGLILCDLHMPQKNGYQVYRAITAVKPRQAFIMTDVFPDQISRVVRDIKSLDCLSKPFDLNEVRAKLTKVLSTADSS